tara:strand:- start:113 stop:823 length:711 start_codon:yes stop_codon:yes gene_type:complete
MSTEGKLKPLPKLQERALVILKLQERNVIDEIFDMVYYINMKKDTDRNENMETFMKDHSIKRYSRVDGQVVDYKNIPPIYYRNFNDRVEQYINGGLGCRLSHLLAIRNAKENNYKQILILEDDIESPGGLLNDLLLTNIGNIQQFDMLFFGGLEEQKFRNQIVQTHAYGINEILYDDILTMAEASGMEIDNFYAKIIQQMSRNDRRGGQYIIKKVEPFNSIVQRADKFHSNIRQME